MTRRATGDDGSTIPLILGFFLIALVMVLASIVLGEAFIQQRDLQDVCDGAAASAAASSADLDRVQGGATDDSLRFADVDAQVRAYLDRDPDRRDVTVQARLSGDRERIVLTCRETRSLALGKFFGQSQITHEATSSSRAAVVG